MLGYVLNLATTVLAIFGFAKDWAAHKSPLRRAIVVLAIVVFGVASGVNTHLSNKRAIEQQQKADEIQTRDQQTIGNLKTAVDTATRAQESNTSQFIASFSDLTQRLNTLQGRLDAAGLETEANQLRIDLASTRRAMAQPLAILDVTLGDPPQLKDRRTIKEISTTRDSDSTISLMLNVVNESNAEARQVFISITVCDLCSYAVEPLRFTKVIGGAEQTRVFESPYLPAATAISIPLKIKLSNGLGPTRMVVNLRCENCEVTDPQTLWVSF